jgi:hypothetical protein
MSARHYPQIPTLALAITFTLATLAAPLAAEAQLCLRLQRGPASEYGRLCRDDEGPRARRSPPDAANVGCAQHGVLAFRADSSSRDASYRRRRSMYSSNSRAVNFSLPSKASLYPSLRRRCFR